MVFITDNKITQTQKLFSIPNIKQFRVKLGSSKFKQKFAVNDLVLHSALDELWVCHRPNEVKDSGELHRHCAIDGASFNFIY